MHVCIYMCKAIHAYVSQATVSQGAAQDFVCMYSMYVHVCIPDPDPDPDPFSDAESDLFMYADLCSSSCELLAQDHRVRAFVLLQPEATNLYHELCATRRSMQCLRSTEPEASQV